MSSASDRATGSLIQNAGNSNRYTFAEGNVASEILFGPMRKSAGVLPAPIVSAVVQGKAEFVRRCRTLMLPPQRTGREWRVRVIPRLLGALQSGIPASLSRPLFWEQK